MLRSVQDVAYPSGGVVAGLGNSAFQQIPNIEGIDATVLDNRAANSTALGVGKLFVEQFLAANSGDANYTLSATAGQALPLFSYGVFTGAPSNPSGLPAVSAPAPNTTTGGGFEIRIRQKGWCLAYCTTGNTYAVAVGTALIADGNGNLTPIGATTPAPGIVLAISKGTLAISQTATLVAVTVGGY